MSLLPVQCESDLCSEEKEELRAQLTLALKQEMVGVTREMSKPFVSRDPVERAFEALQGDGSQIERLVRGKLLLREALGR